MCIFPLFATYPPPRFFPYSLPPPTPLHRRDRLFSLTPTWFLPGASAFNIGFFPPPSLHFQLETSFFDCPVAFSLPSFDPDVQFVWFLPSFFFVILDFVEQRKTQSPYSGRGELPLDTRLFCERFSIPFLFSTPLYIWSQRVLTLEFSMSPPEGVVSTPKRFSPSFLFFVLNLVVVFSSFLRALTPMNLVEFSSFDVLREFLLRQFPSLSSGFRLMLNPPYVVFPPSKHRSGTTSSFAGCVVCQFGRLVQIVKLLPTKPPPVPSPPPQFSSVPPDLQEQTGRLVFSPPPCCPCASK